MASYRFQHFEVDVDRRTLYVGGVPRDVGSRAFDLLVSLIENRERVVSKEWLLEKVWPGVIVEESNLYVQISTLRRAVGAKAISTVSGRGYRLTATLADAPRGDDGDGRTVPVEPFARSAAATGSPPSIVVLPFKAAGIMAEHGHLVDGIVDDIVTGLSQIRRLRVIGSGSSFVYKSREVDVRSVGRELAVRYVLAGSIRVSGDKLRLNARLAESERGATIWGEQLDGSLHDLYDFSDDLITRVVMAIVPSVDAAELDRARTLRPESLAAYDLYLRALAHVRTMTREGSDIALGLLREALDKQPEFAAAAGLAAWAFSLRIPQGWSDDSELETAKGLALARIAIEDDVADSEALTRGGYAMAFLSRDPQRGLPAVERAMRLAPNHAGSRIDAGWVNCYCGLHDRALADFHHFIRLSPRDPMLYRAYAGLSFAYLLSADASTAIAWAKRAVAGNPRFSPAHRALVAASGYAGTPTECAAAVRDLRALVPGLTIERFVRETRFQAGHGLEIIVEGMHRAGLPEH
ncbi:MAG TPA: winged helix-turn-helix domain-containing protein [Burkholderiaceae bacterium]|nr:winged helix-turn-helix domain-containing protein [Burkholderiaceae bacterium]